MPMKLQEVHPALVHFPITLLPLAIGADFLGRVRRKRELRTIGRWGIAAAAVSGVVAGLFGLIAQEEVNVEGETKDLLITHRDLNLGAVAVMTALALRRAQQDRPSIAYLLAGLGTIATVTYSAYLGGHMVYAHGVAVENGAGLAEAVPELRPSSTGAVARRAVRDLGSGLVHTGQEIARGELLPTFSNGAPSSEHVS